MVRRYAFTMIELIFAIVIIAIAVLSLPMMTDVTTSGSADTMKVEEAVFEAYVKALEVTDRNYSYLSSADENGTVTTVVDQNFSLSHPQNTLKTHTRFKGFFSVTQGPADGFGGLDGGDSNISLVTITIKDDDGVVAKLYTYDFNVQR